MSMEKNVLLLGCKRIIIEREKPIETTFELVEVIKRQFGATRRSGGHPAKVFQALRIAVNNELEVFENHYKMH